MPESQPEPALVLEPPILAALFYDVPSLRTLGLPGKVFMDAFGPPPLHMDGSADRDDLLVTAAEAVVSARNGAAEESIDALDRLSRMGEQERLLAGMITVWLENFGPTEDRINGLVTAIQRIDDQMIQARLWMKLASVTAITADPRFPEFLDRAREVAPRGSLLRTAINRIALSNGLPAELTEEPGPDDDLVFAPWLDSEALSAAREQLLDVVDSDAMGLWGWRIRWGQTPFDAAAAAYLRATWAGVLWNVSGYARQYAAQVLVAGPVSTEQAAEVATLWINENGKNVVGVLRKLEPRIDTEAADAIMNFTLRRWTAPATRAFRIADTIRGLWDTISDELAAELLTDLTPLPSGHPAALRLNGAYALLGLRRPERFLVGFGALDTEAKVGALTGLAPAIVEELPREVCEGLLVSAEELTGGCESTYVTLAALAERCQAGLPFEPAEMSNEVVDRLAESFPQLLRQRQRDAAVTRAVRAIEQQVAQAKEGTFGLGGGSAGGRLALIASEAGGAAELAITTLLTIARDTRLPLQHRYDAVVGLDHLTRSGLLATDELAALEIGEDSSAMLPLGHATTEDFEAAVLAARAPWWSAQEIGRALVLSRSPSDSVRATIVSSLGTNLRSRNGKQIEPILLGALFDPNDEIIRTAFIQVGGHRLRTPGAEDVLRARIIRLFHEGQNLLRGAAVHLARLRLADEGSADDTDLRRVLVAAVKDPSWRVRRAAQD